MRQLGGGTATREVSIRSIRCTTRAQQVKCESATTANIIPSREGGAWVRAWAVLGGHHLARHVKAGRRISCRETAAQTHVIDKPQASCRYWMPVKATNGYTSTSGLTQPSTRHRMVGASGQRPARRDSGHGERLPHTTTRACSENWLGAGRNGRVCSTRRHSTYQPASSPPGHLGCCFFVARSSYERHSDAPVARRLARGWTIARAHQSSSHMSARNG